MPPRRKKPYRSSSLTDSARPGGPTTMDVLLRWIATPGNAKRWRTNIQSSLIREIVDTMQEEGLAHRKYPFVRYKLDAMEKKYIEAKKWLLETGMYDAFMRGKAPREVRAFVDDKCEQFKILDAAFGAVPCRTKDAETIDLNGESSEGEEVESAHTGIANGDESGGSKEHNEEDGEQVVDRVATDKNDSNPVEKKSTRTKVVKTKAPLTEGGKRNTVRDRRLSSTGNDAEEQTLPASALQKPKQRVQKQLQAPTSTFEDEHTASIPAEPSKHVQEQSLHSGNATGKEKIITRAKPIKNKRKYNETVDPAAKKVIPEADSSISASATPQSGKSRTAVTLPCTIKIGEETMVKVTEKKETKPKTRVSTGKRKIFEPDSCAVKRMRTVEEMNEELAVIERTALVRRVEEEEKHRHAVYELEIAKLKSELESKQIQLLFEKASARKKLEQVGVSLDEINRILPL
ncbi:hypothetical protein PsorP6_013875 [Peronosclerospora sorghi]|uniref:Uncharacterized protein n=1 Tax=Peronosclerospora sorghi TaxID=230839 RepID=A0ACC0VGZ6_9STRA|nr:hypothetical protein PsorP6_013875 [Peronosclerospora sorghi]